MKKEKLKKFVTFLSFLCFSIKGITQNVGIGTKTPAASAQLDLTSTTKGFLPPRMTAAQRAAISAPVEGLLVFQTDGSKGYYYFINEVWTSLTEEKSYPTVTICSQKWMDKNLDVTTYRNGDSIPHVTSLAEWRGLTTGAWCYFFNDPSKDAIYGKLYNWYAVVDPRGLAPVGWHVPTEEEWVTLETCLGGASVAGNKMKVIGNNNILPPGTWMPDNNGATNSSGWAGQPGGGIFIGYGGDPQINFSGFSITGNWWSSSLDYNNSTVVRSLQNNSSAFNSWSYPYPENGMAFAHGLSVRCLKD